MVETLALHEKLALYSSTQKELEAIKNKLGKSFPKEEFAEIYKVVWQIHRLCCSCQEIPENLDVPEKL